MEMQRQFIQSLLCKRVSPHHLHFGRNSGAARGVGKVNSEEREGLMCALVEAFGTGAAGRLIRSGRPVRWVSRHSFAIFGFLWWVPSWKQGQKLRKLSID